MADIKGGVKNIGWGGLEDLEGGCSFLTSSEGGIKILRGFLRGVSIFSQIFFELFVKNNSKMHLIPFKIALQCILNTFIFLMGGSNIPHNS